MIQSSAWVCEMDSLEKRWFDHESNVPRHRLHEEGLGIFHRYRAACEFQNSDDRDNRRVE
jgi:hypothetical protein